MSIVIARVRQQIVCGRYSLNGFKSGKRGSEECCWKDSRNRFDFAWQLLSGETAGAGQGRQTIAKAPKTCKPRSSLAEATVLLDVIQKLHVTLAPRRLNTSEIDMSEGVFQAGSVRVQHKDPGPKTASPRPFMITLCENGSHTKF